MLIEKILFLSASGENNTAFTVLEDVFKSIAILALLLACVVVSPASPINFQIDLRDNTLLGSERDIPTFSVKNLSSVARITKLEIGIGFVSKNFDRVGGFSAAPTGATRVTPDLINGSVRSDTVVFRFSNFDPDEVFGFFAEIDDDHAISSSEDYRHILFDNGPSPNGYATATFLDAAGLHTQTIVFPDTPGPASRLSFMAVPEPASEILLAIGLGALSLLRRRS